MMASEEDNFDLDIYGDGGEQYQEETSQQLRSDSTPGGWDGAADEQEPATDSKDSNVQDNGTDAVPDTKDGSNLTNNDLVQKIASTDQSATETVQLPKQAPQTQGVKRKEGEEDERHVDPGATTALFVSELHWWVTDDDVRGWANQSRCEDELEDITFSEHKVNGKSKGFALSNSTRQAIAD